MHVIDTAKIPWTLVSKSNRPGRVHRKLVHEGSVSPGVGYTADLVRYEGGYGTFSAPRHKHNFDQIRYVVSGNPDFGHYQVAYVGPNGDLFLNGDQGHGDTGGVVDDLGVDVLGRAEDGQPRAAVGQRLEAPTSAFGATL